MSATDFSYLSKEKIERQKQFLIALETNRGLAKQTCTQAKVPYSTFLKWYNTDEAFRNDVNTIRKCVADYVAGKLFELIDAGDQKSIMFYLKTQAGWTDDKKVTVETNKPFRLNLELTPIEGLEDTEDASNGDDDTGV